MTEPSAQFHCPFCGMRQSRIKDCNGVPSGAYIRRRRECVRCGKRFTGTEFPQPMTEAQAQAIIDYGHAALARLTKRDPAA